MMQPSSEALHPKAEQHRLTHRLPSIWQQQYCGGGGA